MARSNRSKRYCVCERCNTSFPVDAHQAKTARFCSMACRHAPRPIIVNTDGTASVPLSQGLIATVDEADVYLVLKQNWYASNQNGKFYARTRDGGRSPIYLHRLLLGFPNGVVDHVSGDTMDNRRCNLRVGTQHQNTMNRGPYRRRDLPKGVYRQKNGRFEVKIAANGVSFNLGTFDTVREAVDAYNAKAERIHGEYARQSGH